MAEKWTVEETYGLLRAIRVRDILYNPFSINYRNRAALLKTWKEVAEAVGSRSVLECKERWKLLRGQYRKRILTGNKANNQFQTAGRWASELSFLDEYVTLKKPSPRQRKGVHPEEGPMDVLADGVMKEEGSRKGCIEVLRNEIREYLMMKRSTEGVDPFFLSVSRDMLKLSDRDKSLFKLRVHVTLHELLHGGEEHLQK